MRSEIDHMAENVLVQPRTPKTVKNEWTLRKGHALNNCLSGVREWPGVDKVLGEQTRILQLLTVPSCVNSRDCEELRVCFLLSREHCVCSGHPFKQGEYFQVYTPSWSLLLPSIYMTLSPNFSKFKWHTPLRRGKDSDKNCRVMCRTFLDLTAHTSVECWLIPCFTLLNLTA